MELIAITQITQEEKKAGLLSLPKTDLTTEGKQQVERHVVVTNQENQSPSAKTTNLLLHHHQQYQHTGPLVLMQLPRGIEMSDLIDGGCYFVAPKAGGSESTGDDYKTITTARQAALVVESKQKSFTMSRLETSNALVLVPPLKYSSKSAAASADASTTECNGNEHESEGPVNKKAKITQRNLLPVPARLLKPGGRGSSFLECRSKMVRPGIMVTLLQQHVYDPYHHDATTSERGTCFLGRTVPSLALELQTSQGQVQEALTLLQSFRIPAMTNTATSAGKNDAPSSTQRVHCYGMLSEEALQEAQNVILSTLSESDDFGDYAQGIDVDDFVTQAIKRFDGSYPALDHVIRYALSLLVTDKNLAGPEMKLTGTVPLDVSKVAKCLAHRLFRSQKRHWEENRFLLRWQSGLPGVGSKYQTSLGLLRGIAIPVVPSSTLRKSTSSSRSSPEDKDESEKLWRYLPADKLSFEPEERLNTLFGIQEQWTVEDLEPYLDGLMMETGLSQAEILLQYTTSAVGEDGFKLYSLKR